LRVRKGLLREVDGLQPIEVVTASVFRVMA
jgi:hypothetical protein